MLYFINTFNIMLFLKISSTSSFLFCFYLEKKKQNIRKKKITLANESKDAIIEEAIIKTKK